LGGGVSEADNTRNNRRLARALKVETARKQAKSAYKSGDYAAAADFYGRVLSRRGGDDGTRATDNMSYASALMSLERYDEAATALAEAVRLQPGEIRNRTKFGEVLSRLDRHEEAAEQFTEAARLAPDDLPTLWRLALEQRTLGRTDDLRETVDRVLMIDPNHTGARILQMEDAAQMRVQMAAQAPGAPSMPGPQPISPVTKRTPRSSWRSKPLWFAIQAAVLLVAALWLRSLFP